VILAFRKHVALAGTPTRVTCDPHTGQLLAARLQLPGSTQLTVVAGYWPAGSEADPMGARGEAGRIHSRIDDVLTDASSATAATHVEVLEVGARSDHKPLNALSAWLLT